MDAQGVCLHEHGTLECGRADSLPRAPLHPALSCLSCASCVRLHAQEDVYPRMTGRRPLKTPGFVRALFPSDEPIVAPAMHPPPPAPAAPENFGAPDLAPVPAGHDQHAHA
eukprot:349608-Chlamydomonas_euryale.AAC.14